MSDGRVHYLPGHKGHLQPEELEQLQSEIRGKKWREDSVRLTERGMYSVGRVVIVSPACQWTRPVYAAVTQKW